MSVEKWYNYTDESGVTLPPLHPRCRCVIIYREKKPTSTGENYRLITPTLPYKPVSEERYNQLIIPLKKMGVTIMRGGEAEQHLDFINAEASNFGTDIVFFRKKVSVSAILEETHHIRQNRQGMNDDKKEPLRSWLNEIDAKRYLLRVADKYKIPREEIEITKTQLKEYEKLVRANGEWK